jgi:hypothetical protein
MNYVLATLCALGACAAVPSATASASEASSSGATEREATTRQLRIGETIRPVHGETRPNETDVTAYLLVYFKDETHSLHFAVSADGYSFTDVNGGAPVLAGRDISEQRGIRDPHIVRGPDNAFYMAMTDLHIFAQKEGIRKTEWERPREGYGWGNNRSLIFMKSYDLIHWTHSIVRMDRLFESFAELGAAWAPQTIYDIDNRKMMVYYSTRTGNGPNHMVYSYADPAFTTLTDEPRPLFTYPKPGISSIDGDIAKVGDKYRLFYVAHDNPGNLRQAVSDNIAGGYAFDPQKIDPESVGTEAPNLWRRHNSDTYVLMYDVFGAKPRNNMGFSETQDFIYFRDIGHFNAPGSPMKATNFSGAKHGAVMPITPAELQRLESYFAQ